MICSAALLLLAAPDALAGDKVKRLSFDVSVGLRPDMAQLGDTIVQDGTIDTADSTLASQLYSTDQALMSDRNNMIIWHNSDATDTTFKLMGEEPVLGGSLLGMEFGGRVRYELDDAIQFPLYLQTGFHYSTKILGGHQERVLGDVAVENETVNAALGFNGLAAEDFVGGKMITDYTASWYEIPITIGVKVPVKREYSYAYGGVGASFFRGGFSVAMDIDEKYANVLATHISDSEYVNEDFGIPLITNLSPGAVSDTVEFVNAGWGLNYGVGVQVGTPKGLAFFAELNSSGTAGTVYSSDMKEETQQLLTATSSATLASVDDAWFEKLAFPVVTTGAAFRIGLRVYAF